MERIGWLSVFSSIFLVRMRRSHNADASNIYIYIYFRVFDRCWLCKRMLRSKRKKERKKTFDSAYERFSRIENQDRHGQKKIMQSESFRTLNYGHHLYTQDLLAIIVRSNVGCWILAATSGKMMDERAVESILCCRCELVKYQSHWNWNYAM